MKKKERIVKRDLRSLSSDIINMEINEKDTIKSLEKKFFKTLKKHKICRGEKTVNGVLSDNYEWTMVKNLFISCISDFISSRDLFLNIIPEELKYYKEK